MIKMDITDIVFKDNFFDVILCNHVLEHVLDDGKAMRELCRVLKPDGWAVIQVPIDPERERTYENPAIVLPEERERAFGQCDHVRVYGKDFKARLEKAGFNVHVHSYGRQFPNEMIEKYSLFANEDIYVCRKLRSPQHECAI
jgi:ubiquinone/menaquinone biosynthesis C-methylase UbiE